MIKKSSMLLAAAAIFSYGASYVYAETPIHPGMSVDDIIKVIEEHDISFEPPADLPQSGIETDYSTIHPVQPYVSFNYDNPEHTPGPCRAPPSPSYRLTGKDMGDPNIIGIFYVTADTDRNSADRVPWVSLPSDNAVLSEAGVAVGNGWMLLENGDTFGSNWWLITQADVTVNSIEINIWDRYNQSGGKIHGKRGVFDVVGDDGEVTVGSANGYPFTKNSSGWPPTSENPIPTRVIYSVPILGTPSDLFGTMTIYFIDGDRNGGFRGNLPMNLGGFLMFIADTDCMPVQEVLLNSYNNNLLNFTVVGEGAVAIVEEDSRKVVQGLFIVERDEGQKDFTTQFVPTPGTCYVMTDRDSEKVMTDKYCF